MDYSKHLKRAEDAYGKLEGYEEASSLEKCVILLRTNGLEYARIQGWLGCISKRDIRQILLKWNASLIDLDCNYHKIKAQPSKSREKQAMNILKQRDSWIIDSDEETYTFEIVDNKLKVTGDISGSSYFTEWDDATQSQLLNIIKNGN